jgi:hydrogenase maturation protease
MTTTQPARPRRGAPVAPRRESGIAVEVLVCGSSDRADDGAPIAACELIRAALPGDVSLRVVGQLDIDHLLAIRPGAGVVVVDAATGVEPGEVVDLPLTGLSGGGSLVRARSSHALAIPEVVGLAEMIRGRPFHGRVVAIGGAQFGLGRPLSRTVALSLPLLARTVLDAVERVRPLGDATHRGA